MKPAPSPHSPATPAWPRLYSFRRCPYAMRARMALLQAGRRFEVVEVSLRHKPAELLAISPKATVPVLLLPPHLQPPGGAVIDESWDIMCWAWTGTPDGREPRDAQGWWARAQTRANLDLLQRNDGVFKHHLDRWKYPQRTADDSLTPDTHRQAAGAALLLPLQARLHRAPYLGGATPCATDLALMPFVRQFAAVDPGWFAAQAWPAVQAWLAAWLASPLFLACMRPWPGTRPPTNEPALLQG